MYVSLTFLAPLLLVAVSLAALARPGARPGRLPALSEIRYRQAARQLAGKDHRAYPLGRILVAGSDHRVFYLDH